MSCNYADGLSPYEDKGVIGVPEKFDSAPEVAEKCDQLVKLIQSSKHVVVHTGAGISTSAGIPDFRGPNGVWTLEKRGEKPLINIAFEDAQPTLTHMALKALAENGYIHYIISQNIDGLHLKSGISRLYLSELHGNMFLEQCSKCRRQFIRNSAAPTVGQKPLGGVCRGGNNSRPCRGGILIDNVLDWEHSLPDRDLELAFMHSSLADLNITLGTTLQINPSGNLPLKGQKYGGKLVICNLQPTKYDKKADIVISTYVDDVMRKVCKKLGIEIPEYNKETDFTKQDLHLEWTIPCQTVKECNKIYHARLKQFSLKRKSLESINDEWDSKKIERNENAMEIKVKNEDEGQQSE